jgi:magnesium and cobalt transporter
LHEFFNIKLQVEDVDTVAGLVISGFTYLPEQVGEIDLQGFHFKGLKADSRRLRSL